MNKFVIIVISMLFAASCACVQSGHSQGGKPVDASIVSCVINGVEVADGGKITGIDPAFVLIKITFSRRIHISEYVQGTVTMGNGVGSDLDVHLADDERTLIVRPKQTLEYYTSYTLYIREGQSLGVDVTGPYKCEILTVLDPSRKFPEISDEQLLTLVQERTFRYFWDYAHPVSGMARERTGSGDVVTSGGTGFGVMTFPVAVERGFVTRREAAQRLLRIVDFLAVKADRFYGAFPHWLDGSTGKTIPFSEKDNGGDLVETALLLQGLLTAKQYFNSSDPVETAVRNGINSIWQSVEWSSYTGGKDFLYWHWSPDYGWQMNLPVTGWNEALITYVLAASSPTYPISREIYDKGWARDGAMANGKKYFDITLPLGPDYGGPLFFAHYSFLGLDPRGLADQYADYWQQNVAQVKINHRYCVRNPKGWYGYGQDVWGLTASDVPGGYSASSPTEDNGTIAPTAALSSFPYTPHESMKALHYYYYVLGDRIFGEYGFCDSFNLSEQWFASSCLAIDQGPIVIMIENHRSALLWNLFMKNQDIQKGLSMLGFTP